MNEPEIIALAYVAGAAATALAVGFFEIDTFEMPVALVAFLWWILLPLFAFAWLMLSIARLGRLLRGRQ